MADPTHDVESPAKEKNPGKPTHVSKKLLTVLGIVVVAVIAYFVFPPPASANDQLLAIALLVLIFGVAMWRNISMGVVAFPVAFISGTLYFHMQAAEIAKGFPGALVTTLIGVTYLFGVARHNGTIDNIVHSMVKAVHGKVMLLPWMFFLMSAVITASGALSLATYAIVIPLALSFARSHKISPLLMGLSILNGTNAGGFSPIAVYWIIVDGVLAKNNIVVENPPVFFWTFVINLLLNLGAFAIFGGKRGDRLGINPDPAHMEEERDAVPAAAASVAQGSWRPLQWLTVVLFASMVVGAVFFHLDVGYTALCIALVLAIIDPVSGRNGTKEICWGVILLMGGIVTYINMLDTAGVINEIAHSVAGVGTALIAALLMLVIAAVVSAFASTNAMFVVLVPLAAPLLLNGGIDPLGFAIALCISASVVDSSPFSNAGALMLANTQEYLYDKTMKWLMVWAFGMIPVAPLLTWLFFIVL